MIWFLNLSRIYKQFIAVILDVVFLPLTFCLAIWLRYDYLNLPLLLQYKLLLVATPIISIPVFIRLGLYRAVIRFIDHKIVYVVVFGVSLSVITLAALATFTQTGGYSRAVFGTYWISTILYLAASRFIARAYLLQLSGFIRNSGAVRVAIYGAGQAGSQLAIALRTGNEYLPVAFVDDNKELHNATIAGIRVFSAGELRDLIVRYDIKEVLVAIPSQTKAQQKRILDHLEPLKVKIKVAPPIKSLINGELRVQDIREIEIEDLLGRDQVDPDPDLISACIVNKSVMVTGAGGSIGSELCRQIIRQRPSHLILLEMSEFGLYSIEQELVELKQNLGIELELLPFLGSVLDAQKCERIMRTFSVETVYHAAAYKHVPLVEHNPIEGIRNNVFGTLSLAKAAMAAGVKSFVLISTDKAVRPTNVMGSTKRFAELILQAFSRLQAKSPSRTRFCMVRFGNVLGSSGSVVPLFRKQIIAGGPITLTHPEIMRYFMTTPEAAQLVLQAGAMGEGGDVFVLDMGDPVKIVDLAKRMVHLSGLEVLSDSTPDGTIEINHVGLRPGEKLYEELLIGENVEGTEHPLIMRAQELEIPWVVLQDLLAKLDIACDQFNYEEVRTILLRTVAEYTPQCDIADFIWRVNETNDRAA
ncbi:nucleoside-diphosphate sugar epimerase/dehydratase [Glaciimonas sp. Gout2]|uniref:polysaccharide biosynthesis protein n=1 Tax=unclassified Glaciimonas TaxID=2644401 RepID=UPI002B230EE8|nr:MULTISPECIES: nucleoside-diphosphate sugar epimerase/dehydratase [unclassified Glaciimonas]MEB0013785.1 nucleoside-diphosphate sugar epimerase/dehydratase [Glaciimonas sp. Cout2]MEB0083112.1 nucleoside-diphosphate sugar epimerase/dehydratase [Glaciimonas sp. Gout2]